MTDAAGERWLVDVGFGSHSTYPLRFDFPKEENDPGGTFTLVATADGDVDVIKDGRPEYRIETRERELSDFAPTCWWQQTSPDSHFTEKTVCSRIDGGSDRDGRITISGRTLIRTAGGTRTEAELSDDELLAAYRDLFGIELDRVPNREATAPLAPR